MNVISERFCFIIFILLALNIKTEAQNMQPYKVTVISDTMIFPSGTFKACHASTIVEISPGRFLSAWFAGSFEGAKDVCIWTSEFENGSWSFPRLAAASRDSAGSPEACWNPVLFKTAAGSLFLFFKAGPNPRQWKGYVKRSSDFGRSWSETERLPEGFWGPIKNKPVLLDNGQILCASSIESLDTKSWTVHVEIADSNLSSWKKVEVQADSGIGVIQPSVLKHKNGRLQMLCRSRQNVIYETWSGDNGITWSRLSPTKLPNPNSGIDAETLGKGGFILIYNPLLQGAEWYNGRNVLKAAVSENGSDWEDICQLINEKSGEFSYPAVIQSSDGLIHITYTFNRQNIKHVVLKLLN